jgi:hypothetical protein
MKFLTTIKIFIFITLKNLHKRENSFHECFIKKYITIIKRKLKIPYELKFMLLFSEVVLACYDKTSLHYYPQSRIPNFIMNCKRTFFTMSILFEMVSKYLSFSLFML